MKSSIMMSSFYLVRQGEGISNYLKELESYLRKEKVLHDCVAPTFPKYSRQIYLIAAIKSLQQVAKVKDASSVLHIHLPIPSLVTLFGTILKSFKRLAFQVWNPPYNNEDYFDLWLNTFNSEKLFSLGTKLVDPPIVVSSKYLQQVLRDLGASNVHFIPAGIDAKRFSTCKSPAKENPCSEFTILYYGHLTRWKGVENLVKAMFFVKKEYPSAKLKIVWTGHGGALDRVLRLVRRFGLVGQVAIQNRLLEDVRLLFEDATVGVLPLISPVATASPPRTLLEMMAAGLPVVATDVGGVSEILDHGQKGILVESSPASIAEGIMSFLSDLSLSHKVSASAKEYVRRNHDWDRVGPLYVRFYEDFS